MLCCCAAPTETSAAVTVVPLAGYQAVKDEAAAEQLEREPVQDPVREESPVKEAWAAKPFRCHVERRSTMGLVCSVLPTSIEVSKIEEGDVEDYNSRAPVDARIKPGDHITSINGAKAPLKMMSLLKEAPSIDMTVVEPFRLDATVLRDGDGGLGVQLSYLPSGNAVTVGDVIHEVNGVEGRAKAVCEALKDKTVSEL